jgi:hypothetical protein
MMHLRVKIQKKKEEAGLNLLERKEKTSLLTKKGKMKVETTAKRVTELTPLIY